MRDIFEFAEFLASAWRLGNPQERMPTSHGILDMALFQLRDRLPSQFRNSLSFGTTRVGFRCYELPEIIYASQANLLTSEPNPTYLSTEIQISEETARRLLRRRSLDPKEAESFGKALYQAIEKIRKENVAA